MAADAPWTKFYHEDFLQGVALANLTAEEVGVYAVVLMLIAARGGPVEADSRWINGYAGCATVRKCTTLLDRLVTLGKLERRGRLIGNAKMIRTVEERDSKSQQARRAALARWHGDEAELPLDGGADNRGDKGSDKPEITGAIRPGIKSGKARKTAKGDDADATSPVRACDSEVQKNKPNPSHPIDGSDAESSSPPGGTGREEQPPVEEKPGRLDDADLRQLYEAVSAASGHTPSQPGQIDRAMKFVEQWRKDGISFDRVIVPTIKAVISESRDPTRTLGRFDARIRHEHARLAATPEGRVYKPPISPILEPEGEDPRFRKLRLILLERMGPLQFSAYVNPVRFEAVENAFGDRKPVRVIEGKNASRSLLDSDRTSIVRNAVRAIGFTEVW